MSILDKFNRDKKTDYNAVFAQTQASYLKDTKQFNVGDDDDIQKKFKNPIVSLSFNRRFKEIGGLEVELKRGTNDVVVDETNELHSLVLPMSDFLKTTDLHFQQDGVVYWVGLDASSTALPTNIVVVPKANVQKTGATNYSVTIGGQKKDVEDTFVVRIAEPISDSALNGVEEAIKLFNKTMLANSSQIDNYRQLGNVLILEETNEAYADAYEQGKIDALEEEEEDNAGAENAGKSAVYKGVVKDVKQVTPPPKDMSYGETLRYTAGLIAASLGVPVILLNDNERAIYNNYQAAIRDFRETSIIPQVNYYLQEYNDKVLHGMLNGYAEYVLSIKTTSDFLTAEELIAHNDTVFAAVEAGIITDLADALERLKFIA